ISGRAIAGVHEAGTDLDSPPAAGHLAGSSGVAGAGVWFDVRVSPSMIGPGRPLLPVVTYFVALEVNEIVASRSTAPDQNFMVLSFLVLLLSGVVGVCLFSFGLARMIDDRSRARAASNRRSDA